MSAHNNEMITLAMEIVDDKIRERELIVGMLKEKKQDTCHIEAQNDELANAVHVIRQHLGTF